METDAPLGTVYCLVRTDLDQSQRMVQAVHAATKLVAWNAYDWQLRDWAQEGGTLVVVGVENEQAVIAWQEECAGSVTGASSGAFREPDLGGQVTALAVYVPHGSEAGKMFRKLPLI